MKVQQSSIKQKDAINFVFLLFVIVAANFATQNFFFRLDLTTEKRYTLSNSSKEMLENLDGVVFVKVYLDGELNIPYKRFQRSIRETLDELKIYGKSRFQYEFIDPLDQPNAEAREKAIRDMARRGLQPTNIQYKSSDGATTNKTVIPGALIVYKEREIPLNLLENNTGKSGEENINNSIVNLEYKLINTINSIAKERVPSVGFLKGHGELPDEKIGDMMRSLYTGYRVERTTLDVAPIAIDSFDVLVVPKPSQRFSEKDKFTIDQYIMRGGKVIWLIDGVQVSHDSLAKGAAMAIPNDLNLQDMLFRYGVRINNELVEDVQCNYLPINVALQGNAANFQPAPWMYFPLVAMDNKSIITRNLNMVWLRYASSIDLVGNNKGSKATPLLKSSPHTRNKKVPVVISLAETSEPPVQQQFVNGQQLFGVLLEGTFESVFKNRMVAQFQQDDKMEVLDISQSTQMVVIADGDIIENHVRYTARGPAVTPLGYDRYTRQTFGNKEFLSNVIQYLTDDNNLMELKSKNYKIRILDRKKTSSDKLKWQLINILTPIAYTIILLIVFFTWRKYRYTR